MSSVAPATPDERESADAAVPIPQPSSRWHAREQMLRAASAVFVGVGVVSGGQLALLGLSAVSLLCSEMKTDADEVRPCRIDSGAFRAVHTQCTRLRSSRTAA
jgi:hypothetical protein